MQRESPKKIYEKDIFHKQKFLFDV